jgi:hypothetical protein
VHIVACKKIEAIDRIRGNEAGDLIENGERIEGAEFEFEAVGFEPD